MFNQYKLYNEPTNYMTYDSSSLYQYSFKNLDDVFPVYQQYRDPSNVPCDIRPTIYDGIDGVYGENSLNDITQFQTNLKYPNNWRYNIPPQQGYYNQNEHKLNNKRPISLIKSGQASSNQDIHGYLLF